MATRIAAFVMQERQYRDGERDGLAGKPLEIHPHFEAKYPAGARAYRDGWQEGTRRREMVNDA
jgi:hypothetical protein